MSRPADLLTGKQIKTGWTVTQKLERSSVQTGGTFSSAYIVENDLGGKAFLKAMDYEDAMQEEDSAMALLTLTRIYVFEREILRHCKDRRMSRIVKALEDGKLQVDRKTVEYLIFELADGDIRDVLSKAPEVKISWLLRAIHQILVGGQQLATAEIAHQDLKPSNILTCGVEGQKLGDLGRAWRRDAQSPHDSLACAGDRHYAPPELLYVSSRTLSDEERRFGADFYLLGSMVLFLIGGIQASAATIGLLNPEHQPGVWEGTYEQVLPYLSHSFNEVLECLTSSLSEIRDGAEIVSVVEQMCHPDIALRGDRQFTAKVGSRFQLQRFVSTFDRLARRAELLDRLER